MSILLRDCSHFLKIMRITLNQFARILKVVPKIPHLHVEEELQRYQKVTEFISGEAVKNMMRIMLVTTLS